MWSPWKPAVCFFFLLQRCGSVVLDCKATRNGNQMLYVVSNQSHPLDFKENQCDYSWNHATTVIAANYNKNKSAQVISHSINSLVLSDCLLNVSWSQECFSEKTGKLTGYEASCRTTCANMIHGDDPTPTTNPKDEQPKIWIGVTGALVGLAGLAGLIIFLRHKCERIRSWNPLQYLYTAVKKDCDDPGKIAV